MPHWMILPVKPHHCLYVATHTVFVVESVHVACFPAFALLAVKPGSMRMAQISAAARFVTQKCKECVTTLDKCAM